MVYGQLFIKMSVTDDCHGDQECNGVDVWQGTLWCAIMDPLAFWQASASYYHIIVTSQR